MSFSDLWEWLGVLTALIYVFLATRGHRTCFIFGLISSIIFVEICFSDRLYFDTAINSYYIVMSVVGWINWKSDSDEVQAVSIGKRNFLIYSLIGLGLSAVLGYITNSYTDASLPYIDAFTTVFAVIATWMLVRKMIENWIIWIVADAVSIFMYAYKDHWPISILFGVYTLIAIYGYYHWKKVLLKA